MPTLRDVAEKAGVSMATASRVLNNTYRHKVGDETRQRVLRVVAEMGYRSSVPARALRSKQTFEYGLLLPNLAFSYMPDVVQGLQDVATKMEYGCLLYLAHDNAEQEERALDSLLSRRVDGIIWMPSPHVSLELASKVKQVPVVQLLHRSVIYGLPSVLVDQELGGYLAAKHVLELGHRHIACIIGPSRHWKQRLDGYRRALAEWGVTLDSTAIVTVTRAELEHGLIAARQLCQMQPRPTAILAASDNVAWGVLRAAQERSIRVPDELTVIGFGDAAFADQLDIPLTTIRHPKREIGQQAMNLLAKLFQDTGASQEEIVLPPTLIKRASSGPLSLDQAG